ncbi:DUF6766 family protein [Arthrobacter sp. H-02-3]|uniref:DUF6766 family protein n=1 Tax=Arthrobacter sp. H-02-3 TaxID=2703675 RepID=UPI001057E58E|nr:DUF6766 family protein [Arthrobacter sp. H-02-3]
MPPGDGQHHAGNVGLQELRVLQTGQSGFLTVAGLVGASVYLREKGSPESEPVAEPHYETGA